VGHREAAAAEDAVSSQLRNSPALTRVSPRRDPLARSAIRPFVKWAGGKSRLLPRLLPFVPTEFLNYHEPFLGGGAMFFAVRGRATGRYYLSDLNEELVNAWQAMRNNADKLRSAIKRHRSKDSEAYYYSLRPLQPKDPIERAARFFYLNQTAWNGLWRVNRWGEFNVPWGRRPFRGFKSDDLQEIRAALKPATIRVEDFRDALRRVKDQDFVYMDPPYLPLSDTSKFYLYTEKRFREPDLRELADICRHLTDRGVTWLLSNRDTPLVRELFSFARVLGIKARRSVAAQNRRDVEALDSPEVIVVGGSRE
jgi:DNA adenine methylase